MNIFLATLEHDNCTFDAVGRTEAEAVYAIQIAVTIHNKQCHARSSWRSLEDNVVVREMSAGKPCRDRELLSN
jgi:hypothetical protein